jgi:DNA-binding response OmpR family regulator
MGLAKHHDQHRHILVVDDRAEIGQVVQIGLEEIGHYRVSTAVSGDEALRLLDGDPPDVAVLDAVLPGMSGIELAVHAVQRDIPVLLMTGEAATQERLANVGWPYMRKPFHLKDLVVQVEATIAHGEENVRVIRALLDRLFQTSGDLHEVLERLGELRHRLQDALARSRALDGSGRNGEVH